MVLQERERKGGGGGGGGGLGAPRSRWTEGRPAASMACKVAWHCASLNLAGTPTTCDKCVGPQSSSMSSFTSLPLKITNRTVHLAVPRDR